MRTFSIIITLMVMVMLCVGLVEAGVSLLPHSWTDKISGIEIMLEVTPPPVLENQQDYLPIFIDDVNEERAGIVLGSSITVSAFVETGDDDFCRDFTLYVTDPNAPKGMRLLATRTVYKDASGKKVDNRGVYLRCTLSAEEVKSLPPFFVIKAFMKGASGHRKPASFAVKVFVLEPGKRIQALITQAEVAQAARNQGKPVVQTSGAPAISAPAPTAPPAPAPAPAPAAPAEFSDFTGSKDLSSLTVIFNDQKGSQMIPAEFTVEITGQKVVYKAKKGQFSLKPAPGWNTFGADIRIYHPGFTAAKYENQVVVFKAL